MATRIRYRLRMRRPDVGFDHNWSWGSWEEVVKHWWFERERSAPGLIYWQRSSSQGEQSFEIEPAMMAAEAKKLMLRGS